MATFGGPILQRHIDQYGEWVKIFRHRSSDNAFFSSDNDWAEAKQTNTGFPNADKYSILLDGWAHFYRNSKYTLKLDYPDLSITQIWSQTNNPVLEDGSGGVTGYTAISIDTTSKGWSGLERYDAQSATFLDGTLVPQGNWWYAVGSKNNYDSGNPNFPGPARVAELVELWILDIPY